MINAILPVFTESWNYTHEFAKKLMVTLSEMLEIIDGQPSDVLMRLFSWAIGNVGFPYFCSQNLSNYQRIGTQQNITKAPSKIKDEEICSNIC